MREAVVGSTTVRIAGLDAKGISLGSIRFELDGIVSDGVAAATSAMEDWRGGHAETFVAEVNPLLRRMARLAQKVGQGQRAVTAWPEEPMRDPLEERAVSSAGVEVPPAMGTSAAYPAKLDLLAAWCVSVTERVPTLTAGVGLDDVTAEVTRQPLVFDFPRPAGEWPLRPGRPSLLVEDDPVTEPEPVPVTEPADPAIYVEVPDVSDQVALITETAGFLGALSAGVALAFRREDDRLLALILEHPDLADELLSWWEDGEVGAESSLVIVLAYFDLFDGAKTGDEDGVISMEDLLAIAGSTDVPPYVREAAEHLANSPELFTLIETVNDTTQPPELDPAGNYDGDGRMSRDDIELFLEFNDHLTVLDENFATFDNAAYPDRDPDGVINLDDLYALAEGEGAAAATAAWLIAHSPLYDRVARHRDRGGMATEITTESLVVLSVDQQVHADSAPDAAAFVDRHFDDLLGEPVGRTAGAEGMYALFDTTLTESDQRGQLMGRVIDKVAEEGAIHNPGLPLAFANGTAANMDTIHSRINDDFDHGGADGTEAFQNTHAFLRETMRDVDAAEVVTGAAREYFGDRLDSIPPDAGRELHLATTGRTLGVITQAHANAVIAEARSGSAATQAQTGALNFLVGLIPMGGELNDLAGIGGSTFGDLVADAGDDGASATAARAYLEELSEVGAVTMTTDHYNRGLIDPHEALESMRHYLTKPHEEHVELTHAEVEGIFFEWDGTPRERLHLGGMSEEQRTAFAHWATSAGVTLASGERSTPLQDDFAYLQGGIHQAGVPLINRHGG